MLDPTQQRTMEELRQELLWLRDLVQIALQRMGFEESEPKPAPLPVPTATRTPAPDEMIDAAAVAAMLHLTERSIRKYVSQQSIPYRKLGNGVRSRVRFIRSEIAAWVDGAALRVIENGVTVEGAIVAAPPVAVNPGKGRPIKRTPQLKRRLSYTS